MQQSRCRFRNRRDNVSGALNKYREATSITEGEPDTILSSNRGVLVIPQVRPARATEE
jgi:hypothetical protein